MPSLRKRLTDELVADLKPKAKRFLCYDTLVPSLAVRVSKRKTFVLVARLNGHTTRKSIGTAARINVEQARARARRLLTQLAGEVDTTITLGEVLDKLIATLPPKRYADEIDRTLNRDAAHLLKRPIASITKRDVIATIEARRARKSRRRGNTVSAAHHLFSYLRRVMSFAVSRDILEHSPCDRIRAQELIGPHAFRTRVLGDDELRKIWHACDKLGEPYGDAVRLILLSGCRRSEIASARVREFDLINRTLTLGAERTKSAAQHVVYLAPTALKILSSAMAVTEGEWVWGYELRGWSKKKRRLDELSGVTGWTLHDLRRTFRTRLSGLGVQEHVAEKAIAHARKSLARVYDQWQYRDELRDAWTRWHDELLRIVRQPALGSRDALSATTLAG